MMRSMKAIPLFGLLILLIALVACSGNTAQEAPAEFHRTPLGEAASGDRSSAGGTGPSGSPAPAMPAQPTAPAPAAPAEPAQPQQPAPAPAPTAAPMPDASFYDDQIPDGGYGITEEALGDIIEQDTATDQQAALVAQQRIIVRTVDMQLVVTGISETIDGVSRLAQTFGGWVISSDRSETHRGSISIRVPAQRLNEAVELLRGMAVEVEAESSTSQDVTDEYVDLQSRLTSMQATEQALIGLLDKAQTVQAALEVQRELSKLQVEIESIQGRLKFLEETAAFSRINIGLRLSPVPMEVDAGLDRTFSVGQNARFRATFMPPEGIEDFTFTWNFGDGTPPVTGRGTAPTTEPNTRFTATVNHTYTDDRDSPYIVEVEIEGTGDAGLAEGSDTFIATVSRLPTIEVFAGERQVTEEGEAVELEGSFTRPEGLRDIQYTWDFGDGSAPVAITPEEGVTTATITHTYANHRPFPYTATLTVTAQSDAGVTEASDSVDVLVFESEGLVISGWSASEMGKDAIRMLSAWARALAR
jgi:phage terminase Nu1 subunit (DNA packaging protein)